jgi:UDP-N-acetylmuramoyl-tripeptide--D-alanyl-D-alanine ligase
LKDSTIKTHLVGVYNFHNIAAALTIGTYFKLTPLQLKKGIEAYIPANNRSQIIHQSSNEILLDAYNANPSSMEVALENFKGIQNKNKLAILGDMFELGTASAKEHLAVVNQVTQFNNCNFYFVGEHFFEQKKEHPNLKFFETFQNLESHLHTVTISNTSILIKGSRGMALERVLVII